MVDFRLIPPNKRFDRVWNEEAYVLPCTLLSIGPRFGNTKRYPITVEILDWDTGKLIQIEGGYTYQKSVENFNASNDIPPFQTLCLIRKKGSGVFELKVYANENVGFVEAIYNVPDIVNNDENLINEIFHNNYKEFKEWLMK